MRWSLRLAALLAPCVLASSAVAASPARRLEARFTSTATVQAAPPGTRSVRIWMPLPSTSALQSVRDLVVTAPGRYRLTREREHGNRMVHVEVDAASLPAVVVASFTVSRRAGGETGPLRGRRGRARYLEADSRVPITGRPAEIGREVAGAQEGAEAKMRAIYEHVVATMEYDYKKESPRLGAGDVPFVCDYRKGNCSDLHSYVIALARSQGIPAYLEYGFPLTGIPLADPLPPSGKIGGYHCWTWFFVDGEGWKPLDASDGRRWLDAGREDIKQRLFGHLLLERSAVAFSRGRDIMLVPPQAQPPLNTFIYPHAEADGEPVEATWSVTYEALPPVP